MADIEVVYEPIAINSGPVTVAVNGLDDIKLAIPDPIKTETTLKLPDTFKSDGKFAFSIPEPIRTNATADLGLRAGIDLQPVVVDQCLRLSLGPLPATRICLPNRQHVGLTLFGIEIFGITLEGEANILVSEPDRQTRIVKTASAHPTPARPKSAHHGAGSDGVRIRLGD
ncbi:hypothetical protein M0208_03925 [Sphingomonas sp. SUN019]|uniref:hypothetical protein n=1 Tax=Sphingomonas sp. SUN019 TaxID=2937788 RepID=UPI002164B816|nr:hypothetical protein [Sphingomonas sp. SUN019]UVO49699.1 hypothetical protein M0208_03925 [Sphingomonas sp. SUN019]